MTDCINWRDVESAAQELAGNHRKFESFAWFDRPEDGESWCLVYTHNRDSDLVDQSNADVIEKELEPYIENGDIVPERHSHWACGWVDGYAIRIYAEDSSVTEAFKTWCEIRDCLASYPLLDEEDHSQREYDAAIQAIEQEGGRLVIDGVDDWAEQVWSWLWENDQRELENRDGHGAYPSEDAIREALIDLELLDATYCVHIGSQLVLETTNLKKARREFANLTYHASMEIGLADGQHVTLSSDDEVIDEWIAR